MNGQHLNFDNMYKGESFDSPFKIGITVRYLFRESPV